ncbi:hypothetical protein [Lacrimispora sp.]|uniref:hypothetical protein n=1 Tax=Lacrimispora sp. TaxID=2719234 RepID=UPI0032E45247
MEIRAQDSVVPGELKTEGIAEGKVSGKADLNLSVEALKTNEKLIAGEIVLNQVAAQTQSMKEEAKSESEKTEKSRSVRDTASVSDSPEIWDEEEWREALHEITDWTPSETLPLSEELKELARIYEELLLAILTHGTQEGQETGELNQELSVMLQKLLMSRLGDLELLLSNYGSAVSINALRAAICRSVTGKNFTEAELNQIFGRSGVEGKQAVASNNGGIRTPVTTVDNETGMGIIYQPTASGTIKNNPGYARNLMNEISLTILEKGGPFKKIAGKAQGASLTISPLKTGRVYEISDLEAAQRFASYMNREGNLFRISGLSGKSEELLGFLAALMSIKTQIFVSGLGAEKGIAMDLREACDRMTDELIQEMVNQSSLKYSSGRKPVFEVKDVYRIFYHMMNLYQNKADVNETANKGIRYAYQQFLKKKEVSEIKGEPEPFFTKGKKEPSEDFKEGRKQIERDWNGFTEYINNGYSSDIPQGVLVLSPWGMLAEPDTSREESHGNISPAFLLGGGAALVILIIILSFIWL